MDYNKPNYTGAAAAGFTGQINVGAALGGIGYQETRPSQPSRLDTCADHLGKMVSGFGDMNSRLDRVANRLAGAVPEPVEKSAQQVGSPSCTAHRLEMTMEDFGSLLRRMDSLVSRIEAL